MARLKKNGNLSGAIGNIVFVNDGDRAYVRAKGKKPKQTRNTKIEAERFALAGEKEKLYRDLLKDKIGLVSHQYQAVRHKTRLQKTISKEISDSGTAIFRFQNPEAMIGFDFNPKMEWGSCTNFYPKYDLDADFGMTVKLPALSWGEQIKTPKKATTAKLTFYALSVDFNQKLVAAEVLASLPQIIDEQETLPEQDWFFIIPQDTKWFFIIAMLDFESTKRSLEKTEKNAGIYLWAKNINP